MKKYTKDVAQFAGSSIMVGALSIPVARMGGGSGLSTMSSFMPTIGHLTMTGNMVRMLGKTKKYLR